MTTSDPTTIVVIGCAPGSFGAYIAAALRSQAEEEKRRDSTWFRVVEAGLSDRLLGYQPELELNVLWPQEQIRAALFAANPYHVVYAAGYNSTDDDIGSTFAQSVHQHSIVNLHGFLEVAEAFKGLAYPGSHLVAISSNSARVARSPSLGYCVSKAGLSMAVRVLARKWRGTPVVYGYEPGLMDTEATRKYVNEGTFGGASHRMLGVSSQYGLSAAQVAETVAHNVLWGGIALNGTLQQLDAGEQ